MDVTLLVIDAATPSALSSTAAFAGHYGVRIDEIHRDLALELVTQTLAFQARIEAHAPWIGYLCVDEESQTAVGSCGFKGDPGRLVPDRTVEIAYTTFPTYEGRGFGTAAARALLGIARSVPDVDVVLAHTLPEANASGRILTKVGFACEGEIVDPEDGPIWRWRRRLDA
jgi:ribosomal-protein-alanine N-acetyltransferase